MLHKLGVVFSWNTQKICNSCAADALQSLANDLSYKLGKREGEEFTTIKKSKVGQAVKSVQLVKNTSFKNHRQLGGLEMGEKTM